MYDTEKSRNPESLWIRILYLLLLFGGFMICFTACTKDPVEIKPVPQQQQQQQQQPQNTQDTIVPQDTTDTMGSDLNPDKISEHLVLRDAIKMTGDLPVASDGGLKIDVPEMIYLIKGYPVGNRIRFQHNPMLEVKGFNIYVGSASYFFDVPAETIDGVKENDSVTTVVFDLDFPEDMEVDYPFTTEITIQPHDGSGNPLDEFDRTVTIEDPEDSSGGPCNSIMQPYEGLDTPPRWRWDFTMWEQNGTIINAWAPNRKQRINSQGAGCCSDSGRSYYVGEHPSCGANVTGPGFTKITLTADEINDYVQRIEEYVWFFDNGVFDAQGIEDKKNWYSFDTDFCTKELSYLYSYEVYGSLNDTPVGTHDFTPGATRINLDLQNWQGPYRMPRSADIVYTCHTLLLIWESEGIDKFTSRYEDYTTALPEYHD